MRIFLKHRKTADEARELPRRGMARLADIEYGFNIAMKVVGN
jgi:hypothetical protein